MNAIHASSSFACLLLIAIANPAVSQIPAPLLQSAQPSLAPMVSKVTPGVVGISVAQQAQDNPLMNDPYYRRFFPEEQGRPQRPQAQGAKPPGGQPQVRPSGSGVIIDAKEGLVLTNHHVIQGASRVVVVLKDRREFVARIIGSDAGTDVALLRIDPENLTALPMGNSDATLVGDFVIAIGNPFGIGQTVTSGIVSALSRGISPEGYEDYIQTDAAINPGNSGGALVNLRGELIGINTAILGGGGGAEGGRGGGNIGIGFAVPSNMARAVIAQLQKFGEMRRGRVGIQGRDVTPGFARERKLSVNEGAFVESVDSGSPAEKAGVRVGDVVTRINARPILGAADLRNQFALIAVGDAADVGYIRAGAAGTVKIAVAPINVPVAQAGARSGGERATGPSLAGASFTGTPNGLGVTAVDPGSRAHTLGVRAGDIVDAVDRQPVTSIADLTRLLAPPGRHVVALLRGDTKIQIVIQ